MAYSIRVTTVNQDLNPSGGGFHEIHEARFLASPSHAVEMVRSIILLNKVYSNDVPLCRVEVETINKEIMFELSKSDLDRRFGISICYRLVTSLIMGD